MRACSIVVGGTLAARSSRIEPKSAAAAVTSDWPAGGGWEALPKAAGELEVRLFGRWTVASGAQSAAGLAASLRPDTRLISFDARDLPAWDSVLIEFLCKLESLAEAKKIEVDRSGMPSGAVRLVALARAVPGTRGAPRDQTRMGRVERLGTSTLELFRAAADLLGFFGESCIALGR